MRKIFFLIFLLSHLLITAQENSTKSLEIVNDSLFINNEFGYNIKKPMWLTIKTGNSTKLWGGTIDAVNGIENAIVINSFYLKDYENLSKLIDDKAAKYKTGDKINNQTVLLKEEIKNFENIGKAYKMQLLNGNKIYHSLFLFTETKKGYLWIIFTATPETYNLNIAKFKSFLEKLEIK